MSKPKKELEQEKIFVFEKKNYILMLIGLGLMALGFLLMMGGGSEDPNVFNEAIFNTQRITISPLLIIAGIIVEIIAIMYKAKPKDEAE